MIIQVSRRHLDTGELRESTKWLQGIWETFPKSLTTFVFITVIIASISNETARLRNPPSAVAMQHNHVRDCHPQHKLNDNRAICNECMSKLRPNSQLPGLKKAKVKWKMFESTFTFFLQQKHNNNEIDTSSTPRSNQTRGDPSLLNLVQSSLCVRACIFAA